MSKSIYSLLLTDEAIAVIDSMAATRKISRSALIDEILAKHTGVTNTDDTFRQVWAQAENLFAAQQTMRFVNNAQLSLAQVVTSLPYKYNPKVRYCIELTDKPNVLCTVTLNTRTQNDILNAVFGTFYQRLAQLEDIYLNNVGATYCNGKYASVLYGNKTNAADTSKQIVDYVTTLDSMLRAYLVGDVDLAERQFADYCNRSNAQQCKGLLLAKKEHN